MNSNPRRNVKSKIILEIRANSDFGLLSPFALTPNATLAITSVVKRESFSLTFISTQFSLDDLQI